MGKGRRQLLALIIESVSERPRFSRAGFFIVVVCLGSARDSDSTSLSLLSGLKDIVTRKLCTPGSV